jgi:small-conductance mechanosensitive channel
MNARPVRVLFAWLCATLLAVATLPARADGTEAATADAAAQVVTVGNRSVVTLHATLLGNGPRERATLARGQLERVVARGGPGRITRTLAGDGVRFEVDGAVVFFLLPGDVAGAGSELGLDVAAQEVERRLGVALREAREMTDPRSLLVGAGWAAGATVVAGVLLVLLLRVRAHLARRVTDTFTGWRTRRATGPAPVTMWAEYVAPVPPLVVNALAWIGVLGLADLWITFVLRQFAYTRPWGERSTTWIVEQISAFALAIARAVPDLIVAAAIFAIARLVARALSRLLVSVERGEARLAGLDADTAAPTRRLGTWIVWLFAIAMAYPYLPGSDTEAFKGISVLAGVMLSLGASGVVGQALSGLSLMYSRALRVGEYVRVGDVEGTVVSVGMLATRIHSGMGEEISLPSAVVFGQPVRNFSRLVQDGQFVLHTAITIGYATAWRQVHALLLEAARRTSGVADTPAPYVVQTALSDFYVEYRLCAQATRSAPRRRIEAMNALHANIQDVFNEHGVEIMSPHFFVDPSAPQVVPRDAWYPAPARPPETPASPTPTAP